MPAPLSPFTFANDLLRGFAAAQLAAATPLDPPEEDDDDLDAIEDRYVASAALALDEGVAS